MSEALGRPVHIERARPVGGGCINRAARLDTSAGRYFLKHHPSRDGRFGVEARQLEALAGAAGLRVPRPVAHRDDPGPGLPAFLVMEHVDGGAREAGFDEALGRGLAELHRATAPRFGFDVDTFCGSTRQPNTWCASWVAFYRDQRLGVLLIALREGGQLSRTDARRFEALLERLPELLPDDVPPALVHGDLWSGNLMVDGGRPALVDPAAYYGCREVELGMMTLFGGFSDRVYAAYEEAWPLDPGWRERLPLYRLWHVANHALLFGGGYVQDTLRILARFA